MSSTRSQMIRTGQNLSAKPRKKFQSVQHRLESARQHRPVRPDLDSMLSDQTLDKFDKELAHDFEKLELNANNRSFKNSTLIVENNQNELSSSLLNPALLEEKISEVKQENSFKATSADELFFQLSRGIRILPEGLPGQRGMVTPLSGKNHELKLQIDKYCVLPQPWTTEQFKNLPDCVCFRNVLYSLCKKCGHIMKGRVYKNCERHPGIAFLLDYFFCYKCLAETDDLCEL